MGDNDLWLEAIFEVIARGNRGFQEKGKKKLKTLSEEMLRRLREEKTRMQGGVGKEQNETKESLL